MKKLLAFVLAMIMVASMMSISAFAAGTPTFRGEVVEAKAGDTIDYKVYIDNNPGIAGYKVQVDFSASDFGLESQTADEMLNDIQVSMGDFSKNAGNVVSNVTKYGCVALWFNVKDVDTDGVAFTVSFKVAKDAINGKHDIKIRCDAINTIDSDGNLVAFETENGSITVKGGKDGTIDNSKVGPTAEELKQMESGKLTTSGSPVTKQEAVIGAGTNNPTVQLNNTTVDENGNVVDAEGNIITEAGEAGTNATPNADGAAEDGTDAVIGEDVEGANSITTKKSGMGVMQLVLIIVAIAAVIGGGAFAIVKAKAKKAVGIDDEELGIDEVMGWDADDEDDDDEDDEE